MDYNEFIKNNPSFGYLTIKASSASEAIPVSGLKIEVSSNNIIFFNGKTDDSGLIEGIKLPAPINVSNNLEIPKRQEYVIRAIYEPDNFYLEYKVNIYENLTVVQNINVIPNVRIVST